MNVERRWVPVLLVALLVAGGVAAVYGAQQAASTAEEQYVTTHLRAASCLDDWGVDEGAVSKRVAITGVTAGGVRVKVTMPYAYRVQGDSGGPIFADSASEATYAVTPIGTRRVSGDAIEPCS